MDKSWERLPRSPACLAPGQRLPPLARSCRLGVAAGAERDPPHAVVDFRYKMATIAVAQLNEDCFSIKSDAHIVMLEPAHEPRVIQCLPACGGPPHPDYPDYHVSTAASERTGCSTLEYPEILASPCPSMPCCALRPKQRWAQQGAEAGQGLDACVGSGSPPRCPGLAGRWC